MKKILVILFLMLSIFSFGYADWIPVKVEPSPLFPTDSINMSIYFSGIDCADSMNCLAAGNDAYRYRIVYQTNNAGKSWNILYKPDFNSGIKDGFPLFRSIAYPTKNKCIIGSDSGVIIKTDDGGKNWTRINTPIFYEHTYDTYKIINSIKMLDSMTGIASSGQYLIYTSDGGNNWNFVPKPDSSMGMGAVDILPPATIYLRVVCWTIDKDCPYKYTFFKSINLGQNWESINYSNIGGMKKMFFTDSLNGWMVGGDPNGVGDQEIAKIGATIDGGKTWTMQFKDSLKPVLVPLMDVSFKDKNNGIAVGRVGEVMRTTNGGLNWFPDNIIVDQTKPFIVIPVVSYRNVKEPLFYGLPGRIYYYLFATDVYDNYSHSSGSIISPNPASDFIEISVGANGRSPLQSDIKIFNPNYSLGIKF